MPAITERLKGWWPRLRQPGWLCFAWFGMTAGISLLEAPARFRAPLLDRVEALDLGRVVFAALNKAELAALVLLLVLVRASGLSKRLWPAIGLLVVVVMVQSAWLLPELSDRTRQIVAGIEPAPSIAHAAYAVLELLKLGLLLFLGFATGSGARRRA